GAVSPFSPMSSESSSSTGSTRSTWPSVSPHLPTRFTSGHRLWEGMGSTAIRGGYSHERPCWPAQPDARPVLPGAAIRGAGWHDLGGAGQFGLRRDERVP